MTNILDDVHVPVKDEMIYVPEARKYFTKIKNSIGLNWRASIKKLNKSELYLPTIDETRAFFKYVYRNHDKGVPGAGKEELKEILVRGFGYQHRQRLSSPVLVGTWIDARFEKIIGLFRGKLELFQEHIYHNDSLTTELPLSLPTSYQGTRFIDTDLDEWFDKPTKHGLPNPIFPGNLLRVIPPRDGKVATFASIHIDGITPNFFLNCDADPNIPSQYIGAFGCKPLEEQD